MSKQVICFEQRYGTWFVLSSEPLTKGDGVQPPREQVPFLVEICQSYPPVKDEPYRWSFRLSHPKARKPEGAFVKERLTK